MIIALILTLVGSVLVMPASALGIQVTVIDNFEDGNSADWGFFSGIEAGGGGGVLDDRPYEGDYYLSTGWGGNGSASVFYGGLYKNFDNAFQVVVPPEPWFNVWVLNQSDATVDQYTLEITLREDLDGNGWVNGTEDSIRLDTVYSHAAFNDQWTLISAPLSSFLNLFTGGDGTFNGNLDEIVVVISGVQGASGSTVEVDFDLFAFSSGGPITLVDNFENGLPYGLDPNGIEIGFVLFRDPNSTVAITTTSAPPAPVPGVDVPNSVLQMDLDVVSYAGFVHNFENETADVWVTQDWSAYEGISLWIYGNNSGTTMFVDVLDNRNPGSTRDDAERWSIDFVDNFSGWQEIKIPFASMHRKEIGNGAPNDGFSLTEVHGWALGTITTPSPLSYFVDNVNVYGVAPDRPLTVGLSTIDFKYTEGSTATIEVKLSKPSDEPVTIDYATIPGGAIPDRDYVPAAGTLTFPPNITLQSFTVQTIDDAKYQGTLGVLLSLSNPTGGAALGLPPIARLAIIDNESFDALFLDDFETYPYLWTIDKKAVFTNLEIAAGDPIALPGQGAFEHVLKAFQKNGNGTYFFGRTFPIGQDWSASDGMTFWYYGRNSNKDVQVSLENNRAGITDPSKWKLVWSDEFNTAAGTPANPLIWGQEVGDGTTNGIPGWGNDELEYYTAGADNAAADGLGNLQITVKEADGSLMCYYGPCAYTSARLLTKERFEIAYGRVEARLKVPVGAGLWPAFWMLGTDIDEVNWPQAGEIDIMEHVAREPNQVFGTLHGPGYSGGQSYGVVYDLGVPVADEYHIYAVEWMPDEITWYIDGIQYFKATPTDLFLQGKQWVFNHPFFLLLNVAVGGNFGGEVGPDTTFPQSMLVDYVRLYQERPKPITFRTSFREDFTGWQMVNIPFSAFTNDDGAVLDLANIHGIAIKIPDGLRTPAMLDQIRLTCPNFVTVTSNADDGAGSLRKALNTVCAGGTVYFSPDLAGQTITLLSGPLTLGKNVTIDGSASPGLIVSGNNADRVFIVNPGTTAVINDLVVADGYGWQLAGGILNNGSLTLDHVTVTRNNMDTNAGDYWQGGGGIYNGDGATLNLIDSSVMDNYARWSGGGVYAFFNTSISIVRSTISGNESGDVGGGIRSLGNVTIENSTISGNWSTGWHGGAIFHTDGVMVITSSTITNNAGPDWAPSAIFVGSFGGPVPSLTLTNTIIAGNRWYACDHWTGPSILISGGHNLIQDDTCNPVASDLIGVDPLLGLLADNGGPTLTHALLPDSLAIDAGDDALCSAVDQRGVTRPQGAHCDIGSYEANP
jgi:beta-glucanase (GH16 family)